MIKDYIVGIGLDVLKDKVQEGISQNEIKHKLDDFIERQSKYNFSCTAEEEIDFEGLCDYIRGNLLEDVKLRLSGNRRERGAARTCIISKAVAYSQAQTSLSRKRAIKLTEMAIDILYSFYKRKANMADIRLSLCDMKELYSLVLEECSSEMPTIIVVKQMVGVFEGLTHKFFITKSDDKNVMLMFGESDLQTMKSNLRAYLEEFKKLDMTTLDVVTEYSMPLAHRKDMYKHAILISEYLDIVCPQIIATNPGGLGTDFGRRMTYFDESITDKDVPIGDTIFIINRGRSHQIHSVAHELRHCWQEYKSNEGFYENYVTHTGSNTAEQANQKEEIDADAYACLYVEKFLGVPDGTALMYDSEEVAKDWENYTQKVKEHMKNIDWDIIN